MSTSTMLNTLETTRSNRHHRSARRARWARTRTLVLSPLLAAGLVAATGSALSPASAATTAVTSTAPAASTVTPSLISVAFGASAVRIAAAQRGDPYRYGAAGPSAFDCSGLIYYVYRTRLGKSLPRTASAQRLATTRIAKASIRPGDLVFFTSYGRVYHVGVYAGSNKIWHAPRPGQRVQLSRIWTRAWVAGRVR